MDDALLEIVLQRLTDHPIDEQAADLLLAALQDEQTLSKQLDGTAATASPPAAAAPGPGHPERAYLRSLTVTGFRGVGPAACLDLDPGPGLTIVVGRNGSGKSSFAEALEVLLTGDLRRWAGKPRVWQDGWRCLHGGGTTEIAAKIVLDGTGPAELRRTWAEGAGFADSSVLVQVAGEKRAGLGRLGWDDALVAHRPFLSHAELEAFFGSPSGLYDLLASVLGLDDLTSATDRLAAARRSRESALREVKQRLEPLLTRLQEADDERAGRCHAALAGSGWDLAAVRSTAAGSAPGGDGELHLLRRLAQLAPPDPDRVADAVRALREAADQLESVAGTQAGRARQLADLLSAALDHHAAHGDGDCPVCGRPGALTARWREDTAGQVTALREEARLAEAAERAADRAGEQARALLTPPPAELDTARALAGPSVRPARDAWAAWSAALADQAGTPPGRLRAMADHLERSYPPLAAAVAGLSGAAAAELRARDDRWAPLAAQVTAWAADAERARDGMQPVSAIRRAESWLKEATDDIRNARLAPLADQAREIWAMLRQESNVSLGAMRLSGSANRRQVDLDVSVDGTAGSALGVMSQGEVNALALAVFLPRATLPESPFRFLVIDDPVQAMDPAKVDGLARVLERTAEGRQVVVFTHDNRLAEAIRYLNIRATILEVTRRLSSVVSVRRCMDPVQQALRDAGALAADQSVPAEVAARVVPGLCRSAAEAAFAAAVWRQQLRRGRHRAAIEADLAAAAHGLTKVAALALLGDAGQGGQVLARLRTWDGQYPRVFQELNKGAHAGHDGDLDQLVHMTRKLTARIEAELP